ncbi:MAG: hypothetical protein CM1200mP26_07880 [Acidimicrobiales bacterium]|nr:MAG: hypothetical protein CM1200mP26_07880 [Acidimicrobiales bacterium]
MTTNAELLERHRAVLPNWLALYYDPPISFDRGQGRHVYDVEGNRYLDFFGGISPPASATTSRRSPRPFRSRHLRPSTPPRSTCRGA